MSYIDCYRHELVGLFGRLPVYRPLQDVAGGTECNDANFSCSTKQLVIGGGAGEFPGLVLRRGFAAVAHFALLSDEFDLPVATEQALREHIFSEKHFDFANWSVETYHSFYEICTSSNLPNPYATHTAQRFSLEAWLHAGFGEFIFFSMPQLAKKLVHDLKGFHKSWNAQPTGIKTHMHFNNIMLVPPKMTVYASGGNHFFKP